MDSYAVCDEHRTCVTLTLHFRDDDETVPEKANERVAVSEAVEPTSMYTFVKIEWYVQKIISTYLGCFRESCIQFRKQFMASFYRQYSFDKK